LNKSTTQAVLMDLVETMTLVSRMAASLQLDGVPLPGPSESAALGAGLVGKLPAWVARFGLLVDGQDLWLYCEPHPGAQPGSHGQVLLHIPSGRYLVDTFDAVLRTSISRESASGGPLVAGLALIGRPILLWIRPSGRIEEI
jgi:hypothetical protein